MICLHLGRFSQIIIFNHFYCSFPKKIGIAGKCFGLVDIGKKIIVISTETKTNSRFHFGMKGLRMKIPHVSRMFYAL